MNDTLQVQAAFDELSKQHAELIFAFYGFATLVGQHMTKGDPFKCVALACDYEESAIQAGEKLSSLGGAASGPNPHLQFLADAIRNLGERPPLELVTEDLIP